MGLGTVVGSSAYASAMTELECQGQGARKRARKTAYVPAWGDSRCDSRIGEPRDGKWDLIEARGSYSPTNFHNLFSHVTDMDSIASVSAARTAAETTADHLTKPVPKSGTTTFSDEKLRWVPKKRHNTRWPIESRASGTQMVADLQPLIEFDMAVFDRGSERLAGVSQHANERQMRRRSTRRMSRRMSFAQTEDFSGGLATVSPTKQDSAWDLAARLSPRKVSNSPQKAFTVIATPSRVLLKAPPPARSPYRLSMNYPYLSPDQDTIAEISDISEIESSALISEPSQLIFDQPIPDVQIEPEHETRRRVSLQNARRSDRRPSGIRRTVDFEAAQSAPSRRHSFMPKATGTPEARRRHTLDVFGQGLNAGRLGLNASAAFKQPHPVITGATLASVEALAGPTQASVVVDVGTNLDIFGQGHELPTMQRGGSPIQTQSTLSGTNPPDFTKNDVASSSEVDLVIPQAAQSLTNKVLERSQQTVVEEKRQDQAATALATIENNMPRPDSGNAAHSIDLETAAGAPSPASDLEQSIMFAPHDPEGLSTIIEESFVTGTINLLQDSFRRAFAESAISNSPEDANELAPPSGGNEAASVPAEPFGVVLEKQDITRNGTVDASSDEAKGLPTSPTVIQAAAPKPTVEDCEVETQAEPDAGGTSLPRNNAYSTDIVSDTAAGSPNPSDSSLAMVEDDFCETVALDISMDHHEAAHVCHGAKAMGQECITSAKVSSVSGEAHRLGLSAPSPSAAISLAALPGTPPEDGTGNVVQVDISDVETDTAAILESPPLQNTRFRPINAGRISPPVSVAHEGADLGGELDEVESFLEDGLVTAVDYEPTVPITDDITSIMVDEATPLENKSVNQHEDSETELLRKFVTRVKADKNAKAAAAALAKRSLRPKRRSGSTGSATSTTGSPVPQSESPLKRLPLGEKDVNSPSPTKKRKTAGASGDFFKGKTTLFSEEDSPPPKNKRRRKRIDAELDSSLEESLSLTDGDSAVSDAGPRRSTRSRNARHQLKPTAPSANSIALSMIPVRLPGSSGMMADLDRDMPAVVIPRARSEEKDLAAVTRVNTRKNKGNSIPPKMILARQSEDQAWRVKEVRSVFDAREVADAEELDEHAAKKGRESRRGKGVRWAEELVRFQGDGSETVPPSKPALAKPIVEVEIAAPVVVEEPQIETSAPATAPATVAAPEEVQEAEQAVKKPVSRRTRASRLQMPTPIRNVMAEPNMEQPQTAPVQTASKKPNPSVVRMATRRTKIASLGLSVNGTPAPKRRTKTMS